MNDYIKKKMWWRSDEKSSINQVGYKRKLSSAYVASGLSNGGTATAADSQHTGSNGNHKVANGGTALSANNSSDLSLKSEPGRKQSQHRHTSLSHPAGNGQLTSHSNNGSASLNAAVASAAENKSDDPNLSIPHIADFYPEGLFITYVTNDSNYIKLFLHLINN